MNLWRVREQPARWPYTSKIVSFPLEFRRIRRENSAGREAERWSRWSRWSVRLYSRLSTITPGPGVNCVLSAPPLSSALWYSSPLLSNLLPSAIWSSAITHTHTHTHTSSQPVETDMQRRVSLFITRGRTNSLKSLMIFQFLHWTNNNINFPLVLKP